MDSNKAIILKSYTPILLRGTPYQVTFGSYGIVQLAKCNKTGQIVAIKKISYKVSEFQISILRKIRHSNIVQLIDSYFQLKSQHTYLIFEYFQSRTLLQFINLSYFNDRQTINKILFHITEAIAYLHSTQIFNLCLKPQNILLDSKNKAKFCFINFPLTEAPSSKSCRNLQYMAPQIFYEQKFTPKNDIWSLGVLFYQITQGVTPYSGSNPLQILNGLKKPLSFSRKVKTHWAKLITQMLNPIVEQRPELRDIGKKLQQHTNYGKSSEVSKIQQETQQIIQPKIKLVEINELPQTTQRKPSSKRLTQASESDHNYFTKREQKCQHLYSIQAKQKISLKRFMTVQ